MPNPPGLSGEPIVVVVVHLLHVSVGVGHYAVVA